MTEPTYNPAQLASDVMAHLAARGITIDACATEIDSAYMASGALLIALGVEPEIDPADQSRSAQALRELALETRTRTTTRARRAL